MKTMKNISKKLVITAISLSVLSANAKERFGSEFRSSSSQKVMAGCSPAQSSAELTVNNVRTIIYSGSDMWWDLFGAGNSWYYVPKVEDRSRGASSNFAGNVWFGGLDVGGQLKIAAQTYRQAGIDFWTGPLSTTDASITKEVCSQYDKIFKINRNEVDNFVLSGGPITPNIKNWPGNGDISLNQDQQLAPYVDKDGDGIYTPEAGDYPYYDVFNNAGKDNLGICKARVFGDETLWWVYNDNGDVHQATGGRAIGMEIRAQAFAFKTTDEINNMTFYSYQLINRSSFELRNTYMTVWTDADLGYYGDDYIGCDVERGMGYIYNGDNNDENFGGTIGYGNIIPALGCDFFQGPINTDDGIDNNNNGVVDEPGEQMGMTKFLYFNNSFPGVPVQMTDPRNASEYYQYMTGFWRDGTAFTCGGNAYGGAIRTDFVYPGDPNGTVSTDPQNTCGNWNESAVPNDRRFMQSSGPFILKPGAVNYVTFGLPWARSTSTDAKASISLLKIADDKAQALFDNCFKVLSGPEAPDMTIQELNNELILYFSNKPSSNNYLNSYNELDVSIVVNPVNFPNVDKFYRFEGFKVYQLKNDGVTQEELTDNSKAKLVFQCDINNGIKRLINYEFDATTGGDVPKVKAEGLDNGLKSTFRFTQDEFSSTSDKKVVNHKTYYFLAVAYAYNQYGEYKEDTPFTGVGSPSSEGQKRPYLEGRKSKKAYGIPHIPDPEKGGTVLNSSYGNGPKVTRIEGQGNGGNSLELTQASIDEIVANQGRVKKITYENGRGPIAVKVVDPLNVPNSEFALMFIKKRSFANRDTALLKACEYSINEKLLNSATIYGQLDADSATWVLKNISTGKEYVPCKSIKIGEEFFFSEIGMSVKVGQVGDVANQTQPITTNTDHIVQPTDFISAEVTFADPSLAWYSGMPDRDGNDGFNWIRSGSFKDVNDQNQSDYESIISSAPSKFLDPIQTFESVLGGTWAPYVLTASTKTVAAGGPGTSNFAAPAYGGLITAGNKVDKEYDIRNLSSINIVITKDKSKWTRSIVLEECDDATATPTGARKLEPRKNRSVDKQGIPTGSPGCNENEALLDTFNYSLGWFPGYAINLETGERLNIAFGEDSYQDQNNGRDMMWNPTTAVFNNGQAIYPYAFGGRHYIYVFGNSRPDVSYVGATAISGKNINGRQIGVGNYSKFEDMVHVYKTAYQGNATRVLNNIWTDAMWVNIPMLSNERYKFNNPADMPTDITVKLRVNKAYRPGLSGSVSPNLPVHLTGSSLIAPSYPTNVNAANGAQLTKDMPANPINNNFGYYTFNTADIFTETNSAKTSKSALDLINVVPNPYYAYSTYEKSRIDNVVRITNLPNKCKIKIFTLNGNLIRTFDRDVTGQEDLVQISSEYAHSRRLAYQDWDLKNQSGILVASGLYIIHIDVPGVGEKILKWFGVMRPYDLQNY